MRHPLLEDADALTEAIELLEYAMHQGCPTPDHRILRNGRTRMSSHRRPAPESATVFINDEETRAATGIAMTISKPGAPVIVFPTTGGALIATRALKRGHARHMKQHNIDWWRYYVTLFTRTNRVHYQKQRVLKFLRR